jgi:hypothetical protein
MDFFLRDGDEQRARGAVFMDDIDLIPSEREKGPWGASLVAVAVRHVNGMQVQVCQCCGEPFDESKSKLRGTEVHMGFAIMKLHTECVNKRPRSSRSFSDIVRGMQGRRFFANATQRIAKAVSE